MFYRICFLGVLGYSGGSGSVGYALFFQDLFFGGSDFFRSVFARNRTFVQGCCVRLGFSGLHIVLVCGFSDWCFLRSGFF